MTRAVAGLAIGAILSTAFVSLPVASGQTGTPATSTIGFHVSRLPEAGDLATMPERAFLGLGS